MVRVSYQELFETLLRVLLKLQFEPARARLSARLFADSTRDGVYSHGLNRFPQYVKMIENGCIDIHALPELMGGQGSLERWDGKRGPGNVNAYESMDRAMSLARENGVGSVALGNTNHWMRGGSYGWQAADAGFIGICWTNTLPNLPPWGASTARVGNNPLVIAIPRPNGHIVLDMAMSQFSYGALASYRRQGKLLPVDGGFDSEGRLTRDPAAIEASKRALPIGYWKGSGLSLLLDVAAAMLSGGLATHQIPRDTMRESGVSQVFVAFNVASVDQSGLGSAIADAAIEFLHSPDDDARYPGEQTLRTRAENPERGIPLDTTVWQEVQSM